MNLPNLTGRAPTRRQEITFGGLNLTDGARAGELRECTNVSTRRYPVLSPRRGRTLVSDDGAKSVYEWDGKLVKVIGSGLYYQNDEGGFNLIGAVDPAPYKNPKSYAVVNTKMCVWPDKVYVDLTNNTFGAFEAEVDTLEQSNSVKVTSNSIEATITPPMEMGVCGVPYFGDYRNGNDFYMYTYGHSASDVAACYVDGAWVFDGEGKLNSMAELSNIWADGVPEFSDATRRIAVGDVIIPAEQTYKFVYGKYYKNGAIPTNEHPDTSEYNDDGYYGIITRIDEYENEDYGTFDYYVYFDIYKAGVASPLFSTYFKEGDCVDITGSLYAMADADKAVIESIATETNTLRFTRDVFFAPTACADVAGEGPTTGETKIQFSYDGKYYFFDMEEGETFPDNFVACITDGKEVMIWSTEERRIVRTYTADSSGASQGCKTVALSAYDTSLQTTKIKRGVPDLDYICESSNRLWGVSNSVENKLWNAELKRFDTFTSRCIYASALGEPGNFWTFEGLSTDSWQTAVGSEGDFTGICSYDGVLCWKEQKMYRIAGSYPSEYYMFERDVEGVQKGSGNSLVNIDEALYYKGRDGVYAYRGGVPQLVSAVFGNNRYGNAAAGTDGQRYYISMKDSNDQYGLYVYDTLTNLWVKEDDTQAVQFCQLKGKLLMLTSTGILFALDEDTWKDPWKNPETGVWGENPLTWSAVFAPFDERDMHDRKYYLRVLLRVDVGEGGAMLVYVDGDGSSQYKLVKALGQGVGTVVIPLFPYRIDEFKVALVGTGNASVLSIAREYKTGSIYGKEGVAT